MSHLIVKNPHSILAAIIHRPKDVLGVALPTKDSGDAWLKVKDAAQRAGVRLEKDNRSRGKGESDRTGLGEARIQPKLAISCEELFRKGQSKGLWLALDCIQDPHNLGSLFRTASFFGIRGILLTEERSAPITGTVLDVSAGGVESVAFAQETNLARSLQVAKDAGLWVLGTSEHAKESLDKIKSDRPWLLVLGNEEKGLRRLTQDSCDLMCSIPFKGGAKDRDVTSLNVSVAAAVLMSRLSI